MYFGLLKFSGVCLNIQFVFEVAESLKKLLTFLTNMRKSVLIVLILLAGFTGCRSAQKKARMKQQMETNVWVNPVIEPVFHQGIEAIFPENQDVEAHLMDREGLIDFCARMNALFANSGLIWKEADFVYQLLYDSGLLFNEPMGMPDPEEVREKETIENFKTRIAIKKNEDLSYSLFYVKIGCGYTYFFGNFIIPEKDHGLHLNATEVWRASMPC